MIDMDPGSDIRPSALHTEKRGDLLVLGYQGTLTPIPHDASTVSESPVEAPCVRELPLEFWLADALRRLHLRSSAEERECGEAPIDFGALVEALRHRLRDMLAQIVAICPDGTEESLSRKFPALTALIRDATKEWVEAVAVFLERFHRDGSRLAEWLGYAKLPNLMSLRPASSDLHAGGHRVLRVEFSDGRSIYYKPRAVTGEWLWDRLIHAVNGSSSLQLASARTLAGPNGRYGWVAPLQTHSGLRNWDKNSGEARRYWHAAGATLCLAEHMRMSDLHMANVMATPCGPGLFDAETLGTPPETCREHGKPRSNSQFLNMMDDLMDTGLLPSRSSGGLPDASGLFGRAAETWAILVPRWSTCTGSGLRVQMVPASLVDQGNAPPVSSHLEVLPLLVSGYREAASALIECRDGLLSTGSRWRWTLESLHAPRIVLRDTLQYGMFLSRSLSPELLYSPHDRRNSVEGALRGQGSRRFPESVRRVEIRNLLQLHVPRFTAMPCSRTLAGGFGRALAPRFFACSPGEAVVRKMSGLSPKRLSEIHVPGLLLAVLGQHP
jgi:lantibiotic modifying enzyme